MNSNVRARSYTVFTFWPALDGVKRIFVLLSGAGALQQLAGSMHTCDTRFWEYAPICDRVKVITYRRVVLLCVYVILLKQWIPLQRVRISFGYHSVCVK